MATSRRNVLAAGAAGVAGLGLAACGGSGSASGEASEAVPAAPAPAASGDPLVAAAEVPVGSGVIVDSGQTKVVVTQPTESEFVGLSAVCPHQGCLVSSISKGQIICPCHGSRFSITDGAVLQGPAMQPLEPVAIEVSGDQIVLG